MEKLQIKMGILFIEVLKSVKKKEERCNNAVLCKHKV